MKQFLFLCLAGTLLSPLTLFAQSGTLDNSFGINGKYYENFGVAGFELVNLLQQPDGKILVGGYAQFTATGSDFVLARFTSSGAPDAGFGTNGVVTTNISGSSSDELMALRLLPDGKILVAGNGDQNVLVRYNSNGSLDNSFDSDGILVITNPDAFSIKDMQVQSDGKIVLLGDIWTWPAELAVLRLNTAGAPDLTFDGDGVFTWNAGTQSAYAASLALQADGKILVGGLVEEEDTGDLLYLLLRLTTAGVADNSFAGGTGFTTVNPGPEDDELNKLLVLPDGNIMAGGFGYRSDGAMVYTTLVRYTSSGIPDATFNTNGIRTISSETTGFFSLGAMIADGNKTVLTGVWRNSNEVYSFAVLRLNADGGNDNTFGTNGIATTGLTAHSQLGVLIARQTDGNYLTAGYVLNGKDYTAGLLRLQSTGAVDASFDGDGLVEFMMSNQASSDQANVLHVFSDDAFLIGGNYGAGLSELGFVKKFRPDGTPDPAFGTDGRVNLMSSFSVRISDLTVLSNGQLIVAGSYYDLMKGEDLVLYRLNANGTPDPAFGNNGKVVIPISANTMDLCLSIGVLSDGRLVMLGLRESSNSSVFYLLCFTANGTLDASFGTGGKTQVQGLTTNWDSYRSSANMLLVQPDDRIVVVGSTEGSMNENVGLRRYTPNGVVDATFNSGMIVSSDLGGDEYGVALALQSDGKLVVSAQTLHPTYGMKSAVLRYLSTGAPDNSFGTNGQRILAPISPYMGWPAAVLLQPDQKILMAGSVLNSTFNSFMVVARLKANAEMDSSFGTYGVAILPNTADGYDATMDMRLQSTGKILLCGFLTTAGQEDVLIVRLNNTISTAVTDRPNTFQQLQLAPNPVRDELWLRSGQLPAGRYFLRVTTADGKLVDQQSFTVNGGSLQQRVATGRWPNGVLLVTISSGTSQKTFRVVKE